MVGAVLVRGHEVIAEAYHSRAGEDHAERKALNKAGSLARGATLYVTLEPCCHFGKTPPCTEIIITSGVSRVVAAVRDPFPRVAGKGFRSLKKAGIDVMEGVLQDQARRLNEAFFTFHEQKRPFVTLKWAMSLDGRTSTDSGLSKWITGDKARSYAHKLRSWHDAIAVGVNTVLLDDPRLTVRLPGFTTRQPCCVILDTRLRTPPQSALFREPHRVIIACGLLKGKALLQRAGRIESLGASLLQIPLRDQYLDIHSLLQSLYTEGIQSLLVEGGRHVAGSFIQSRMVDKLMVFIAPKMLGGLFATSPALFPGFGKVTDALELDEFRITRPGPDILLEGYVKSSKGYSKKRSQLG
jgi:diaminohydroxyphosphoribosylaminopyrimidine deaminase/5-amino-6-(5-phosphoribosylamino)uracil reductase